LKKNATIIIRFVFALFQFPFFLLDTLSLLTVEGIVSLPLSHRVQNGTTFASLHSKLKLANHCKYRSFRFTFAASPSTGVQIMKHIGRSLVANKDPPSTRSYDVEASGSTH
jgi:hypothetical protein